ISLWFPQRGLQATVLLVAAFLGISAYFSFLGTVVDPIITTLNAALYIWVIAATTLLARDGGIVSSKYKKLFDDAEAGIFLYDLESSRVMETNATLERTLEYQPKTLLGRSMDALWVYPEQRTLLENRLRGG